MIYDSILDTVGGTPVVRINRLAPEGVKMYVKVEAFNPMGSVKDRLALGVILDAEAKGLLKPGQTVIEATSGNTGIGLAMVGAFKGYRVKLALPECVSTERRQTLLEKLMRQILPLPFAEIFSDSIGGQFLVPELFNLSGF